MVLSLEEKRAMIEEEERRFKKIQKAIDRRDKKELERYLRSFAKEERAELKRLNKRDKKDLW